MQSAIVSVARISCILAKVGMTVLAWDGGFEPEQLQSGL